MKSHASHRASAPDPRDGFRHLLREELARRCSDNPRYSLRAFAAWLDVDHSSLSQLLRGKRRMTEATIRRFGSRLGLDDVEIARHVALEERLRVARDGRAQDGAELTQVARDAADVIREWEHFALLELTRLGGFRADTRWVARVLGVTHDRVNLALQRLVRLGLLRMESPDRWVDTTPDASFDAADLDDAALRSVALAAAALARDAARRAPDGGYEHATATVAVDGRRLDEVRARVARFFDDLRAELTDHAAPDRVVRLDLSLYPVSRDPGDD